MSDKKLKHLGYIVNVDKQIYINLWYQLSQVIKGQFNENMVQMEQSI